VVNKSKSNI